MDTLQEWAAQWNVSADALADLQARMGALAPVPAEGLAPGGKASEAAVLSRVRLAGARAGMRLFRNNSGAGYDESGNFMRWGLGNDSQQLNAVLKSSDLVGIRPHIIQYGDVGKLFGRFVSLEVKHEGWTYKGTDREKAQLAWLTLINTMGGEARFVTSEKHV